MADQLPKCKTLMLKPMIDKLFGWDSNSTNIGLHSSDRTSTWPVVPSGSARLQTIINTSVREKSLWLSNCQKLWATVHSQMLKLQSVVQWQISLTINSRLLRLQSIICNLVTEHLIHAKQAHTLRLRTILRSVMKSSGVSTFCAMGLACSFCWQLGQM